MLDFSPDITASPELTEGARAILVARERREVFSIHPELRALSWGGAMLIAASASVLIARNADVLGPTFVAWLIGLAAAACYAWAWRHRGDVSVIDDYVLLLGALLLSADLGFIEQQFDVFGAYGHRHFLLLAVAHGVVAYLFDSRLVLTLAVSAMAAWIGVERRNLEDLAVESVETALRLFTCALAAVTWREADRRLRSKRTFERPFEHFTANFALLAGLSLVQTSDTRLVGLVVTMAVAAVVIVWGFRTHAESFVLYGFLYAVIAADIFIVEILDDHALVFFFLCLSALVAIAGLFVIHARFQRSEP